MTWRPKYTECEIRDAVENSPSLTASLPRLGLRVGGANPRTLKRHIAHYGVSTEHFNPNWALRGGQPRRATRLEELLVENSNYNRGALKRRLYDSGLKARYDVLIRETVELGFSAVGRKYGVSDNAVRKWVRWYETHTEPPGALGEAA